MDMTEGLKLVLVESQPEGYLVTYASGDTAFFEKLPDSLPPGCMVQGLQLVKEEK